MNTAVAYRMLQIITVQSCSITVILVGEHVSKVYIVDSQVYLPCIAALHTVLLLRSPRSHDPGPHDPRPHDPGPHDPRLHDLDPHARQYIEADPDIKYH